MDIIEQAQAKREQLQREVERIEAFLATAYELQEQFGKANMAPALSDADKADVPKRRRSKPTAAGSGSATLQAVKAILCERDKPMSTRELLPLVRAKGVEVGGKDALATLSARISQKGLVEVTNGRWWFIDEQASDGEPSGEETVGHSGENTPTASLLYSDQGERRDAAALAN